MSAKSLKVAELNFDEHGLIPAIVQSSSTNRVLMMAWMNAESIALSIESGRTVFYSRSRSSIWRKGETSGNIQVIQSIEVDCDNDCLLVKVIESGPACHTNADSCFDTGSISSGISSHG
jgi:phosphoribosyl-AMP cyclohydrolase